MKMIRFSLLILCLSSSFLISEEALTAQTTERPVVQEKLLATAGGEKKPYEVHGGTITVNSKSSKDLADVYFTAYFAKPTKENSRRPIAFCFNGGPGASSACLHMGFLGPKICAQPEQEGSLAFKENPLSLLSSCDLVFVDPVSTGFSKPLNPDAQNKFFGIEEDIQVAGDFIRSFLIKFERWNSPKILIGESYGTARAIGLTNLLMEEYYIKVDGLILISLVLDFQTLRNQPSDDLVNILNLPTIAAIAHFHKKLEAPYKAMGVKELSEKAISFALHDLASSLLEGSALAKDKTENTATLLSQFTSLPQTFFLSHNLRLSPQEFMTKLLKNEGSVIGRFDGRIKTWNPPQGPAICDALFSGPFDPSFYSVAPLLNTAINDYFEKELHVGKEEPYILLSDSVIRSWNWDTKITAHGFGYPSFQQDLRHAFAKNPNLSLFVAAGYYDLATPFFSQKYSLDHLFLPQEMEKNTFFKVYEGGHMMYLDEGPRKELSADLSNFVKSLHK